MKARPSPEAVGDQAAADPVLLAQHLVFELGTDAQDVADRPVAVDRLEVLLRAVQVIVDQPRLAAVDGDHGAAAARIERQRHPGRRAHHRQQARRADVGRLHALNHRRAREVAPIALRTMERAPSQPDQVLGGNLQRLAGVEIARVATMPCWSCVKPSTDVRLRIDDAAASAGRARTAPAPCRSD